MSLGTMYGRTTVRPNVDTATTNAISMNINRRRGGGAGAGWAPGGANVIARCDDRATTIESEHKQITANRYRLPTLVDSKLVYSLFLFLVY
jgi:hypothetical protein